MIKYIKQSATQVRDDNPLIYSSIITSFLKWCRNLILYNKVIYRDTACGLPRRTVQASLNTQAAPRNDHSSL